MWFFKKESLFVIVVIALTHIAVAFLLHDASRPTTGRHYPITSLNLFGRFRRRHKKVPLQGESLQEFQEYLTQSLKTDDEQVLETVAVKFVNFVLGEWDCHVGVAVMDDSPNNNTTTFNVSNKTREEVSENIQKAKSNVKEAIGMRIESTYNLSSFPPRDQYDCYVGPNLVLQALGLSSYDLIHKKYTFTLDEMIVFGVNVNMTSVMAAAQQTNSTSQDNKPSIWKRVFQRRKKNAGQ